MKHSSPLAWFEIIVQDFDRAVKFYESAFNIKFQRLDDDKMQHAIFPYNEPNSGGSLVYSKYYADHKAGPGTTLIYLNTDSITKQLEIIQSLGGSIEMPSTDIGENGYIGVFIDSEGNYVGLWSQNK